MTLKTSKGLREKIEISLTDSCQRGGVYLFLSSEITRLRERLNELEKLCWQEGYKARLDEQYPGRRKHWLQRFILTRWFWQLWKYKKTGEIQLIPIWRKVSMDILFIKLKNKEAKK